MSNSNFEPSEETSADRISWDRLARQREFEREMEDKRADEPTSETIRMDQVLDGDA